LVSLLGAQRRQQLATTRGVIVAYQQYYLTRVEKIT